MTSASFTELKLHQAVKKTDIQQINTFLSVNSISSIDINEEDENGVTALIEACIIGNESIVKLLLDAGCPAQPAKGFRHSPLRGTTVCGQAHLIPLLLKFGADPNALSDGGRTPLMAACFLRKGVPDEKSALCVKALLEDSRVDPTIVNSFGETALELAILRGYDESIALVKKALSNKS